MATSAVRKHDVPRNGSRPEALRDVLSAELFLRLLVRERKRSERANRPFILLSLKAKGSLKAALAALAAAMRGTDIIGWIEWPTVVGVIFPEIGAAEPARAVETIRTRVYRELRRSLDGREVGDLSLEFRVYPESNREDVDLAFHPDLRRRGARHRLSDWLKRGLDVVASLALLLGFAPLLFVVAAAVQVTSRGPVLFRQPRLGEMGKSFRMLKFRTMYIDAGENPHVEFITRFIKESGRVQTTAKNQVFKLTNDSRITPVGRILRKTSLDELPQLWNVLVGEMSLVGPRPPLPYEFAHYAPWHRRRVLEAKPGITGLWQVTGRSRTTFDEMVRLDLRYARTRSLWTDLRILLRTPGAVVSAKGAR